MLAKVKEGEWQGRGNRRPGEMWVQILTGRPCTRSCGQGRLPEVEVPSSGTGCLLCRVLRTRVNEAKYLVLSRMYPFKKFCLVFLNKQNLPGNKASSLPPIHLPLSVRRRKPLVSMATGPAPTAARVRK